MKKFKWIKAKNNSCVYDSFLTIFILGIYNKNKNLWYVNHCKKCNPLKFLIEDILADLFKADEIIGDFRNNSSKFETFKMLLECLDRICLFKTSMFYEVNYSVCDSKSYTTQNITVYYHDLILLKHIMVR